MWHFVAPPYILSQRVCANVCSLRVAILAMATINLSRLAVHRSAAGIECGMRKYFYISDFVCNFALKKR